MIAEISISVLVKNKQCDLDVSCALGTILIAILTPYDGIMRTHTFRIYVTRAVTMVEHLALSTLNWLTFLFPHVIPPNNRVDNISAFWRRRAQKSRAMKTLSIKAEMASVNRKQSNLTIGIVSWNIIGDKIVLTETLRNNIDNDLLDLVGSPCNNCCYEQCCL
uniref:Uncharacterized protein n=1 Tax=Glossina pallidipes TaxID=7398 RepID=A0A1B0ACH0_GLOPL